jgi:DNA-binding CsgD family transcriptional regulator/PAS domain-containing protein
MHDETAQLSYLIGNIYDAALDPTLWPSVLEITCGYIEGVTAVLVSQDSAQLSAQFHFSWGDNPEYTKSYNETYIKLNPALLPFILHSKLEDVIVLSDVIPYDEFLASRFYKEWAKPQGYSDTVHATLEKSLTSYAAVAVARHERQGLVDDRARRRMRLLAPHFRRAVAIGKTIDMRQVEAAAFADTLDGLAAAMFLVDAAGRVVRANAAAHVMLAQGSPLLLSAGKLAAVDVEAGRVLHDVFISAERGDDTVGAKGIAVPLTAGDGERFVAHVLPLTAGARRMAGREYSAVAAVFVRKAQLDPPHPIAVLADAFKLTPAELRVLMAIVQIGGIPEVAPVLGISETTVKTHLQHVFEKTGTNRQADLVKLVAGYMSPLAG